VELAFDGYCLMLFTGFANVSLKGKSWFSQIKGEFKKCISSEFADLMKFFDIGVLILSDKSIYIQFASSYFA
jgi:hypothetical protein